MKDERAETRDEGRESEDGARLTAGERRLLPGAPTPKKKEGRGIAPAALVGDSSSFARYGVMWRWPDIEGASPSCLP